jgi:hypothetical protein
VAAGLEPSDESTAIALKLSSRGRSTPTAAAASALKDTLDAMRDEGRRLDDRAVSLSLAYLEAIVQTDRQAAEASGFTGGSEPRRCPPPRLAITAGTAP